MGDLPAFRVERQVRPFIHVGLDFFGPFMVSVGRRKEKRYGAIFTCMAVRAVHLEVAESLSTDTAINVIRRFVARRGCPKQLFSDNATNFRGACKELKIALRELDTLELQKVLVNKGIDWHFVPPGSPHMGGSWERLVRSVKVSLEATLKERAPRGDVLHTLFTEAEFVVNSRPLTFVSLDPKDKESLTPNHFLIGPENSCGPPGVFEDADLRLRKQWRFTQRLADHFWCRWVKEYLPDLTRKTKWFRAVTPLKVGDVVVVADNTAPRNTWPKGILVRTFPGKNGQVRVVDVMIEEVVFRRPAIKICKLDICDDEK
ncbi:unnamed protein product [Allacma fusca]|uniref:Integrase catalytic domain-containing protein n=1 Tax=Allacma fusca TaxID=39272 RepID=A0A8J2NS14_9HEXA|nr:unnamed protein product [Allacma fusca]